MFRTVFVLVVSVSASAALSAIAAENPQIATAQKYVANHKVIPTGASNVVARSDEERIGRDPETSVTSFVHAIRRNAKQLLSARQSQQWESFVTERSPQLRQLHDTRNVLRAYFFACAWEVPLSQDGASRMSKQKEMREWLDVWMDVRLQEQVSHHKFCRDAWALLTNNQRDKLVKGDWDHFVKKSTGHKRAYFGDRIVNRVLGKPNREADFQLLSDKFSKDHVGIQKTLFAAEARYRKFAFTVPAFSDEVIRRAWLPVDKAYRAYFLSQARHIDELSRAGYDLSIEKVKTALAEQPESLLGDLDKKINEKLKLGKELRRLLEDAKPGSSKTKTATVD